MILLERSKASFAYIPAKKNGTKIYFIIIISSVRLAESEQVEPAAKRVFLRLFPLIFLETPILSCRRKRG